MNDERSGEPSTHSDRPCLSRRSMLLGSGAVVVTLAAFPGCIKQVKWQAIVAKYPRKVLGKLSELEAGKPMPFLYPSEDPRCGASFLVKLDTPAGGGVGPDLDVVAFNALCPHMGGPLSGFYKHEFKAAGPCPLHLTTFDLTRHGMVIAGHATESLPQVVLEVVDDEIHATGVMGLIFGTPYSSFGAGR